MGDDIGDDELAAFADLEAAMEREFAALVPATTTETDDAPHR
jgi:hypothetical protein